MHIKLKGITHTVAWYQIVSGRPPPFPHLILGVRPIGQKSTFSEHVHVAYQIKWNHKSSNMVVNILSADLTARPWGGVKIQLLQNMVMLHIKLNGIMDAVAW